MGNTLNSYERVKKTVLNNLMPLGGFIRDCAFKGIYGETVCLMYDLILKDYPDADNALETAEMLAKHVRTVWQRRQEYIIAPVSEDAFGKEEKSLDFIRRYTALNCEYIYEPEKVKLLGEFPKVCKNPELTPLENALAYIKMHQGDDTSEYPGIGESDREFADMLTAVILREIDERNENWADPDYD